MKLYLVCLLAVLAAAHPYYSDDLDFVDDDFPTYHKTYAPDGHTHDSTDFNSPHAHFSSKRNLRHAQSPSHADISQLAYDFPEAVEYGRHSQDSQKSEFPTINIDFPQDDSYLSSKKNYRHSDYNLDFPEVDEGRSYATKNSRSNSKSKYEADGDFGKWSFREKPKFTSSKKRSKPYKKIETGVTIYDKEKPKKAKKGRKSLIAKASSSFESDFSDQDYHDNRFDGDWGYDRRSYQQKNFGRHFNNPDFDRNHFSHERHQMNDFDFDYPQGRMNHYNYELAPFGDDYYPNDFADFDIDDHFTNRQAFGYDRMHDYGYPMMDDYEYYPDEYGSMDRHYGSLPTPMDYGPSPSGYGGGFDPYQDQFSGRMHGFQGFHGFRGFGGPTYDSYYY